MFSFFFDEKTVPDVDAAWEKSRLFIFSFNGIVDSVPLIVFAFMFQVNVPQIQEELER
jgi:amino acid permease